MGHWLAKLVSFFGFKQKVKWNLIKVMEWELRLVASLTVLFLGWEKVESF